MFGEHVRLAGDDFVVRAVQALADLRTDLPDHALIGGLAVMVRLQQTHRVTGDLDFLSDDEARTVELLVDGDAIKTANGVRLRSGVDLDLIDASEPGIDIEDATDTIEQRAIEGQFAFARALRMASPVSISVSAAMGATIADIRVATTADLIVLKLHSAVDPRRAAPKRGSDVYDVVRLLLRHGTGIVANALTSAPEGLRASVVHRARLVLVDDADRSAATLRSSSVRGVETVAPEQLETLGRALVDAISRATPG